MLQSINEQLVYASSQQAIAISLEIPAAAHDLYHFVPEQAMNAISHRSVCQENKGTRLLRNVRYRMRTAERCQAKRCRDKAIVTHLALAIGCTV